MADFQELLDAIRKAGNVAFFTGAGVSTLSGIPDFRGPDGIYRNKDYERLFDIDLFDENPEYFYENAGQIVYNEAYQPGPVHTALVALQKAGRCAGVITQNIDMLHERAGSSPVYAVHGTAALHHCRRCNAEKTFAEIQSMRRNCLVPRCSCGGVYKPDITFFGEGLPDSAWAAAIDLASRVDLMIVLGSSLVVSPANLIPQYTLRAGGRVAIVNNGDTPLDRLAFFRASDLGEFATAVLGNEFLTTVR